MLKAAKIVGVLLVLAGAALALSVFARSASHDRDWVQAQAQVPQITFEGDLVTVQNVRNFSYATDRSVTEAAYYNRTYDLSELTSVWYGISHFAEFAGMAHTFLSFGFADDVYLTLSIEARREVGEAFSPVKGLFRNYELIYVLGDERDVIGSRSHIRGERVQLYRVSLTREVSAELFRLMLTEAQNINAKPQFYNTLIDNCTTGIFKHARRLPPWRRLFDYRIVLPGYSDGLLFDYDLIGAGGSLTEARHQATINPDLVSLETADFSAALRERPAIAARTSTQP